VFERFTDHARRVVVLAQEESLRLSHHYIGTEHILLGLVREGEGVAVAVLGRLGADLNQVRQRVTQLLQDDADELRYVARRARAEAACWRERLALGSVIV